SWGVKNVDFFPLGFYEDDYDPNMAEKEILDKNREIDCILLCERQSKYREKRLNKLTKALPNLFGRGKGWPEGFLPQNQVIPSYQNSKIGLNIHNSVGPVNLRTYMLPANGVMQICDNKHMLGYLFTLGKEIVGYDTIEEGIELVEYYLTHENKRKQIALNGWKRALKDYSETAVWELLIEKITQYYVKGIKNKELSFAGIESKKKLARSAFPKRIRAKGYYFMNRFFNHYGYELQKKGRIEEDFVFDLEDEIIPYYENPEAGPINLDEKEKRLKNGGFFEWPNMIALNQTVVSLLGNSKTILEIGSGTGCFAWHAAMDNNRYIVASEMDKKTLEWTIKNRSSKNIQYVSKLLNEINPNSFDIVVAVDVIEHIKDYSTFLKELSCVAPKAIITTPNKSRNEKSLKMNPPEYYQHVREWTIGEFYWILKVFYQKVRLYSMPNPYIPSYAPINILSRNSPIIAVCYDPSQ
ncbi:MAG: glycosyltransferase, partial [Candidatus Hodarchaeota archaeon]